MEGRWKGISTVLVILAGLAASGSSYQIIEGPKNATVLEGSEARFNCTVSQGWKLIMWALNGTVVLSITPSKPIITNDRFTSASYQEGGNSISEMIIHDVQLRDAGHIKCSLQNSDRDASAFLSVQVMGALLIPGGNLVVAEDEPCNVTCHAWGWIPPPGISWDIGLPVSHSSYHSVLEPNNPQSAVSVLTLTPQGNGTLTCVATMKGLHAHKSVTVNLTVVQPPLDAPRDQADNRNESISEYMCQVEDGVEGAHWEPDIMLHPRGTALSVPMGKEIQGWQISDLDLKQHRIADTRTAESSIDKAGTSLPTWAIILLAVSFSLLLILIIVLIIIICCCCVSGREIKESSYQSEIRKSASVKTNKETFETNLESGSENLGYHSDEPRTAKLASFAPVSSESSVQEQHSSRQPYQGPDRRWRGPAGRSQVSFPVASPRTVRNVTLV